MTAACGGGGGGGGGSTASAAPSGSGSGSGSGSNSAPTISGTPQTQVSAGSTYRLAPAARDSDGDPLAFSIQNRPSWATFNTATGELSGTPTAEHVGTNPDIVISVSDGRASAELPSFTITVAAAGSTPVAVAGAGVALSWDVPTQTVSGANLGDLSGYRIHYGTRETAMTAAIEITSAGLNTYTVQNLSPGTYYFAVKAVTANGAESEISNVISRVIG